MYKKLVDFFYIAKIVVKGLFQFFKDLGLDTDKAYTLTKDIDDIGDGIIKDGRIENYID